MKDVFSFIATILDRFRPPTPCLQVTPAPGGSKWVAVHHSDYRVMELPAPKTVGPAHEFLTIQSLADWLHREAAQGRARPKDVEVLVEESAVKCRLSAYEPHAPSVSCPLLPSSAWAGWMSVWGKPMDVDAVVRHCRAFEATLPAEEAGKVPLGQYFLAQLQQLTIISNAKIEVRRDSTGRVTAVASGSEATVSAKLPSNFELLVAPFASDPQAVVAVRVLVETSLVTRGDQKLLVIRFDAPDYEEARREALQQLSTNLQGALGDEWLVASGRLRSAALSSVVV